MATATGALSVALASGDAASVLVRCGIETAGASAIALTELLSMRDPGAVGEVGRAGESTAMPFEMPRTISTLRPPRMPVVTATFSIRPSLIT